MREEQTLPEMPEREAFTAAYMAACKNQPADWNEIGYWYARQLWQAGFNAGIAEGGKDAGWRDIETAPKDQTHVLIANNAPGSVHPREGYYVKPEHRYENEPTHAGWWRLAGSTEKFVNGRTPTHWRPLPKGPDPIAHSSRSHAQ